MSESTEISDLLIIANICECDGEGSGLTVMCDVCDKLYHRECLKYSHADITKRIRRFVCNSCEATTPFITEWKLTRATREQKLDKRQNYFEVEQILKHKIYFRRGERRRAFQIKWKGYSPEENSWVPETSLDGCLDTLQKYLKDKGLPLSNIVGLLGASSSELRINKKNWVSMEQILNTFEHYRAEYFPKTNLPAENWIGFKDNDGLYFLSWELHCFVVLYYHEESLAYIADGGDIFLSETDTADEIRRALGVRLIPCSFIQHTRADFCGSSAVLIGLELIRSYQAKTIPSVLAAPKSWRDRIVRRMHKYHSASLELFAPLERRQKLICQGCGKSFRFGDRRKHARHQQWCLQKPTSKDQL